ncbi:unnamed protein product [Lymnaea stagnalis]|uniref:HMG box domain-containing protein n=1 Tax=Lymnaea stagnalis TaxID=6523 RepID=A0AAV2I9B3_LYMST
MAATIAGRFCNKLQHIYIGFKQLQLKNVQLNSASFQLSSNKNQCIRLLSHASMLCTQSSNEGSQPVLNQKPKYPPNVFFLFLQKIAPQLKKENPDVKRKDLVSQAAKMWNELNPEEKSHLAMERREHFEKYKEDLKVYLENITPEQITKIESKKIQTAAQKKRKERRAFGMPRKPVGAFSVFVAENFSQRTDNVPVSIHFKTLLNHWNQMSDAEKDPYIKKTKELKAKYQEDIAKWEKEMIQVGRFHLVRKTTLTQLAKNPNRNKKQKQVGFAPDVKDH